MFHVDMTYLVYFLSLTDIRWPSKKLVKTEQFIRLQFILGGEALPSSETDYCDIFNDFVLKTVTSIYFHQ